jgi:hypothetical protein
MPALAHDTRLVMTILYVGTMCGANVYFYDAYGTALPFTAFSHAMLFGLCTIGVIMVQKSLFDLAINDRMEMWLMDRKIKSYWERKQRDEQQRGKALDSINRLKTFPSYQTPPPPDQVSSEFLAQIEQ